MKKRICGILLILCMVMVIVPLTPVVATVETVTPTTVAKDITLGTSAIQEPTEVQNDSGIYYTPSSYIYFGNNGATPIKWRVLDADKANDGTTDGMFLLSEYVLSTGVQFNANKDANQWQESDAQTWCKNFVSNSANFSSAEQNAMLGVAKTDAETWLYGVSWGESKLTTADKLFFLSAEELATYVGNYDKAPGLGATTDATKATAWWWLRPPYAYLTYLAGVVYEDGVVGLVDVDRYECARPALNLNLSSVLFTSAAKGGKSGAVGEISTISDYNGKELKLTMKDECRKDFTVTEKSATGFKGETISFNYDEAVTGSTEYISAIIVQNGMVLYYGKLANATSVGGLVPFTIPSDIDYGTYDLCIFNEQINGDEKTDLSSDFQKVTLTVNKADPSVPTGLVGTAETIYGKADGKITGVTTAMEYRKEGDTDYTAITGTEITGLANGKYYVRYKADDNHNASADAEVTIGYYTTITFDPNGSTVDTTTATTDVNGKLTTIPTPTRKDYSFLGWFTKDGEMITTDTVFTEPTTVYAHWQIQSGSLLPTWQGWELIDKIVEANKKKDEPVAVEPEETEPVEEVEPMWNNPFSDVTESDAFYEAIKFAYENSYMNGMSSDTFAPSEGLTRAMLVTVLYRAAGSPVINDASTFTDVADDAWYHNAVVWAKSIGLVNGITETEFAPESLLTREQLVTIFYRYATFLGLDVSVGENTNILSYEDFADIAEYAIPAMQWACGMNLIDNAEGNILPKDNATRALVAMVLYGFYA